MKKSYEISSNRKANKVPRITATPKLVRYILPFLQSLTLHADPGGN